MYRKIAMTAVTINLIMVLTVLGILVPLLLEGYKNLKFEMPTPVLWVISASHFVTNPFSAAVLPLSFFVVWKALDKWAARRS